MWVPRNNNNYDGCTIIFWPLVLTEGNGSHKPSHSRSGFSYVIFYSFLYHLYSIPLIGTVKLLSVPQTISDTLISQALLEFGPVESFQEANIP